MTDPETRTPASLSRWAALLADPTTRLVAGETLRTIGLVLAMFLAVGVLVQFAFQQRAENGSFLTGLWEFLLNVHRNKDGIPLMEFFPRAAWQTLRLSGLALAMLGLMSIVIGAVLAQSPCFRILKTLVLAFSAVPSFVWPFVPYLIAPPFSGFTHASIFWPALALSVGDLNLITVSTLYAESLRHEFSLPHARTAYIFRGTAWVDVGPRSAVAIVGALGARVPHLLGGTIALEVLYDIHGIGFLAWKAIVDVPPDYHVLLWVCGLGILVSRILYIFQRLLVIKLLPDIARDEGPEEAIAQSPLAAPDRTGDPGAAWDPQPETGPALPTVLPRFAATATAPPGLIPLGTWFRRARYYLLLSRAHWIRLATAIVTWAVFTIGIACCVLTYADWQRHGGGRPNDTEPFLNPSEEHLLGTNASGEDIMLSLGRGLRQQTPPLLAAVVISCVPAVLAALVGAYGRLLTSRAWTRFTHVVSFCIDGTAELIESLPKIVVLLACVSYFAADGLIWKMYVAIGLVFMPQIYRAVRDDLALLVRSQFLEAVKVAGVSRTRIVFQNVLRNHCLHVVAVQSAVLLGCIVHVDAMLGFLGVRSRGEVFTWGSILGMGVDEFMQIPFTPPSVVWGPAVGIWLMILAAFTLADALKIPLGGYVYRLK